MVKFVKLRRHSNLPKRLPFLTGALPTSPLSCLKYFLLIGIAWILISNWSFVVLVEILWLKNHKQNIWLPILAWDCIKVGNHCYSNFWLARGRKWAKVSKPIMNNLCPQVQVKNCWIVKYLFEFFTYTKLN